MRRRLRLGSEGVHFCEDAGGFGFEGGALLEVVALGVLAGAVLEVEVAEVFVDDFFTLTEVVEASFFDYRGELLLRPEDVGEAGEEQKCGSDDRLQIHNSHVMRELRWTVRKR